MLDTLFLTTYALSVLVVTSCGTAENVWFAKQVSLVHVIAITLIGLCILIYIIHSVHNNVGLHIFIY